MDAMADGPQKGVFVNPNINGLIWSFLKTSRDIRRRKTTNILTKTSTKALKETNYTKMSPALDYTVTLTTYVDFLLYVTKVFTQSKDQILLH